MSVDFSSYRIQDLRDFFEEKGYDEDQFLGKRKVELVDAIMSNDLEDEFERFMDGGPTLDNVELDDDVSTMPTAFAQPAQRRPDVIVPVQPDRGTKEWHDYVMGLFNDDEKVNYTTLDGKKIEAVRADGLRRVGELALGQVISSGPVEQHMEYSGVRGLPAAWVKYKIIIRKFDGTIVEYSSLGDVNYVNTDNTFLGFALLTAETRAKGRAWREALGVRTYAIEEFSGKKDTAAAVEEISSADWKEQPITTSQIRTIRNLCGKLKIDPYKLINVNAQWKYVEGKERYESLEDEALTNKQAATLIGKLNEMQQGSRPVDESVKLA